MQELLAALPLPLRGLRPFPMDGALLLFDRDTGWNVLCDGPETEHLRQLAPRVVQFGITNRCNMACRFCSRDVSAESGWTAASAFALLRDLADAGVLEVAFGGGEPLAFPGMLDLIRRLHDETPLAVNLTTNGLLLTPAKAEALRPHVGQLRLSLYEDNRWRERIPMLAASGLRFGVNYLVTPERLPGLEDTIGELLALGCRDVLLLSYNGRDASLHLSPAQSADLAARVRRLWGSLEGLCELKLDVCWGERMSSVPRLFEHSDCGAGREFLVVTSDRRVSPCSFHHLSIPFDGADDLMAIWRDGRGALAAPTQDPGCARTPGFGLDVPRPHPSPRTT